MRLVECFPHRIPVAPKSSAAKFRRVHDASHHPATWVGSKRLKMRSNEVRLHQNIVIDKDQSCAASFPPSAVPRGRGPGVDLPNVTQLYVNISNPALNASFGVISGAVIDHDYFPQVSGITGPREGS